MFRRLRNSSDKSILAGLSGEQVVQRVELYAKMQELIQLRNRVEFLESDLPRMKELYRRLTIMIKQAEEDYKWMEERIDFLENENRRLRELLSSRRQQT
ncbi:MAG: hypothetical protein QXQ39_00955 [Conexivisphaerales archaeon]